MIYCMRRLTESDLFSQNIDTGNVMLGKINKILSGAEPSTVILNKYLRDEIKKKIVDKQRTTHNLEMLSAIETGRIVLFTNAPEKRLSDAMPFFVYEQNGMRKVAVNLASTVIPAKSLDGEVEYTLGDSLYKIFGIIHCAYLALDVYTEKAVLTPAELYSSAVLWSEMLVKPIIDAVGLNSRTSFMYFAMKFFLRYYIGTNDKQAESVAMKYIGKKNDMILFMEEQLEAKQMTESIYEGIIPFLKMLFNNEITNIKGIRVANISNSLNVNFYLGKFVSAYGSNTLLSLCAYPYFIYIMFSAFHKTKMLKDKAFDKIFQTNKREINKLMTIIS